jgi:Fe-S-cluster containining protein
LRFEYPENVRFECTKCGLCCGDTPEKTRHVLLLKTDAARIAAHTKRQIGTFANETQDKSPYVYEMHKAQDGKCVFLQNNRCVVYNVRPLICRFYPFELLTDENVVCRSRVTDECPGVFCQDTVGVGKKLDAHYFRVLFELARDELNSGPT